MLECESASVHCVYAAHDDRYWNGTGTGRIQDLTRTPGMTNTQQADVILATLAEWLHREPGRVLLADCTVHGWRAMLIGRSAQTVIAETLTEALANAATIASLEGDGSLGSG